MQRFDCLGPQIPLLGPHFLEASAGTGKTFAIEHIVARLLLSGIPIDQILIVTFTRAATRELKVRVRSNLEKILANGSPYLEAPSERAARRNPSPLGLGRASYLSICGKELAAPFRSGESPSFQEGVLQKLSFALAAFDRSQIYTLHGFCFRMLQEFAFEMELPFSMKESQSSEKLDAALRDFFELKLTQDIVSPEQLEVLLRTRSVEDIVKELKKGEAVAAKTYRELEVAFINEIKDFDLKKLREDFANLKDAYRKKEGNFDAQLKALAAKEFGPFISEKGSIFALVSPENKKVRAKETPPLHYPELYDWGRERLLPIIESALHESLPAMIAAWKPIEQRIVLEEGTLSPDALLQWMQEAIQKKSFREKVQKKYRAVLIDEFQDTDPVQWDIFQTLFLNADALYLIGDPKQSIYRFRKADLYTYLNAKEVIAPEHHFYLDTNFRSSKELIAALNRLFDRNWLTLPREKKSLPYIPVRAGLDLNSQFSDGKGAIHCLISDSETLYPYVAAEILRLKTNSYQSFAILVKDRFQAAKMEEVLNGLGIPNIARSHELITESLAFEAIEELFCALEDVRNLGKIKTVAAGPFGELDLFTLRQLLEEKGLVAMCSSLPNIGPDALQVFELLFEWERSASFSYEGVHRFFAMSRRMDPDSAICLSKESEIDAVQIMTMHVSKGLEFDIVFALGLAEKSPACDEEIEAEKQRLLYVAMTRAKRRVYLPIPKKSSGVGKLSPIELFCKTLGLWEEELQKISEEVSLTIERIEAPIELPNKIEPQNTEQRPTVFKIPPFNPSYLLSFTSLAKENHPTYLEPMDEPNGLYSIHNLPRGAETGIVIHSIFERVFAGSSFLDLIPSTLAPWKEAIVNMVETVLDLPLPMGFSLRDIAQASMRTEVEFLFATSSNYVCGFIDLIFAYKNTLYFADWKTNWLGKDESSYGPEKIETAMREHQYHLQASIYAEALRRSWAGPIGGGLYFFVRGPKVHFIKI